MSKLIDEPIMVKRSRPNTLAAFIWRRRLYRVIEILGWWHEPARWWDNEAVRLCIRVNAKNTSTGTYELCRISYKWFLHRVLD